MLASVAFGDGAYQRTKDGKTLVWNDDSKPGDEGEWSGDRDREGYASGFGTLTWYRAKKGDTGSAKSAIFGRYSGNMVRGKFNGPVNAHSKEKTDHAIFADGIRTTPWMAGPAGHRAGAEQRGEPSGSETAAAKEEFDQRATINTQRSAQNASGEGPSAAQIVTKSENAERPIQGTAERPVQTPAANKLRAEVDDSLRALVVPPPFLRINTVVHISSAGPEPEAASSPGADARLTQKEVTDLADAEARAQGYNLDQYQRPKADYSAVKEKWSLFYDQKLIDGMPEIGKYFSVTVDDKTKKVEIKK